MANIVNQRRQNKIQLAPALVCLCMTEVHSMLSEIGPESHVHPEMPATVMHQNFTPTKNAQKMLYLDKLRQEKHARHEEATATCPETAACLDSFDAFTSQRSPHPSICHRLCQTSK